MDDFRAAHGRVALRPLSPQDASYLYRWLNDPRILEWYEGRDNPQSMADIETHFLAKRGSPAWGCLILEGRQPAGYIQVYPLNESDQLRYGFAPQERAFGIDLFIGESSLWNQGLGTEVMTLATRTLVSQHQADAVVVDPRVENARAIHVYDKCGFHIDRRLPHAERHEGQWHDCWLMIYRPSKAGVPSHNA